MLLITAANHYDTSNYSSGPEDIRQWGPTADVSMDEKTFFLFANKVYV